MNSTTVLYWVPVSVWEKHRNRPLLYPHSHTLTLRCEQIFYCPHKNEEQRSLHWSSMPNDDNGKKKTEEENKKKMISVFPFNSRLHVPLLYHSPQDSSGDEINVMPLKTFSSVHSSKFKHGPFLFAFMYHGGSWADCQTGGNNWEKENTQEVRPGGVQWTLQALGRVVSSKLWESLDKLNNSCYES